MHTTFATFLNILPLALAHTRFTTLHINGVSQGDGTCIRQDQDVGTTTNFVDSITGPDMACGKDGEIAVPNTCNLNAGDTISLEHRMWPDASQPGAIDISHKGNTAVYMKKMSTMNDAVGGDGWFKIYWDGYNTGSGQWGTDNMNNGNGMVSTSIPIDLAPGQYLVRSEVLALQVVGSPQMYVGCAQVNVAGSGNTIPADTTSIPGYINMSTSAMTVNIYESFTFSEYGPKLYGNGTSSASQAKPGVNNASPQIKPGQQISSPSSNGNNSPQARPGQQTPKPPIDSNASPQVNPNQWKPAPWSSDSSSPQGKADHQALKPPTTSSISTQTTMTTSRSTTITSIAEASKTSVPCPSSSVVQLSTLPANPKWNSWNSNARRARKA